MDFVLILYAQIIFLLLETTSSQYDFQNVPNPYYQNLYQNAYQNDYQMNGFELAQDENEDPQTYQRSRKHQKRKPYSNSEDPLPIVKDYTNEESEDCKCSCNRCDDPEPCCKNSCSNCNIQNQQNFVLIPYLYPLFITPKVIVTETTTTTTTKPSWQFQQVVTSSTENDPSVIQNTTPAKNESLRHKTKYMLTSLRRTKPVWLPKYGLVPIPDRLAEKLMSKLREVKGLKAERRKRMIEP